MKYLLLTIMFIATLSGQGRFTKILEKSANHIHQCHPKTEYGVDRLIDYYTQYSKECWDDSTEVSELMAYWDSQRGWIERGQYFHKPNNDLFDFMQWLKHKRGKQGTPKWKIKNFRPK